MKRPCCVNGCGRKVIARSMCESHYRRWRRHGDPLAGGIARGSRAQWLHLHKEYSGDDCLIWPFSRHHGYAVMSFDKKSVRLCRILCEEEHGPPPSPIHEAAHSCGNGHLGCVNRRHLRWATPVENNRDKIEHGTLLHGARHPNAKLDDETVETIRRLSGSQRAIARQFNISQSVVSEIRSGKAWRHL
jgi:hypothetical protein